MNLKSYAPFLKKYIFFQPKLKKKIQYFIVVNYISIINFTQFIKLKKKSNNRVLQISNINTEYSKKYNPIKKRNII